MRRSLNASRLVGFCLTLFGLAACQAVAGIEDRTLDPNADKPKPSQACDEYCTLVMDACSGEDAVYTTRDNCLGVCAELPPGDSEDTTNNTLACRKFWAKEAEREVDYCISAGPGGNGRCGSDCEAYCDLFPVICPDDYKYGSRKECLKFCETLTDKDSFDVVTDHEGDSIECRLVHLTSATTEPKKHCPHAVIPPTKPYCINPADKAPTCESYCKIVLASCGEGDLAQYESEEQCLAVCEHLDPGTNDDQTGNTVGCRRYHAFSASTAAATHCFHAGPSGDGHCGDRGKVEEGHTGNCESYCHLVAEACSTDFANELGDAEACMKECVDLPEAELDSKYTVASGETSRGLHCRMLYTVRAFEDPAACASALGRDHCK